MKIKQHQKAIKETLEIMEKLKEKLIEKQKK
jgi:hypothetical protein